MRKFLETPISVDVNGDVSIIYHKKKHINDVKEVPSSNYRYREI